MMTTEVVLVALLVAGVLILVKIRESIESRKRLEEKAELEEWVHHDCPTLFFDKQHRPELVSWFRKSLAEDNDERWSWGVYAHEKLNRIRADNPQDYNAAQEAIQQLDDDRTLRLLANDHSRAARIHLLIVFVTSGWRAGEKSLV